MTTRGPAGPDRRTSTRRVPAAGARRATPAGGVRRDGRTARARPNRNATPRPALRRATSGSTAPERPGDRVRLTVTTRAALLGLTLCLVALTMAYPLRAYFTQRATISDLRSQQRADQQAVADLQRTVSAYQNPASVQDEARRRLHFQLPGEKVYYLPPAPAPAPDGDGKVHTPALPDQEDSAWYAQLWGSAVETSR